VIRRILFSAAKGDGKMTPARTWRRRLTFAAGLLIGGAITAELALRTIGIGNPPLYLTHPTVEYMLAQGAYRRFGNNVTINSAHMRATPEGLLRRADPRERRVLVLGDSIIYGGDQTDDSALAVTRLRGVDLGDGRPLVALNISCNSWGMGNLLAYLKEFGTFEADSAVIVFNSFDYGDVREFVPLGHQLPTSRPWCALDEARHSIPRLLALITGEPYGDNADREANPTEAAGNQSLDELRQLLDLLKARGITIAAVHHPRRDELDGKKSYIGASKLFPVLEAAGVPIISNGHYIGAANVRTDQLGTQRYYRDHVHLNAKGQECLLEAMVEGLKQSVK
jgi:hypothetical protein